MGSARGHHGLGFMSASGVNEADAFPERKATARLHFLFFFFFRSGLSCLTNAVHHLDWRHFMKSRIRGRVIGRNIAQIVRYFRAIYRALLQLTDDLIYWCAH